MGFIEVEEYNPYSSYKSLHYTILYGILSLLPLLLFYIIENHLDSEIIYFFYLIPILCFILYNLRYFLVQFIKNLKQLIFERIVYKKGIIFYKPHRHEEHKLKLSVPQNDTYLNNGIEIRLKEENCNNFIILNNIEYKSVDILNPYCDIIACEEAMNNPKSLWLYFLTIFMSLYIIHSLYIFKILDTLHRLECNPFVSFLLFFIFLTVSLIYILYLFIEHINLNRCDKIFIEKQLEADNTLILEDIDSDFYILNAEIYFSQKKALQKLQKIKKTLSKKLENIFQLSIPIFYILYIPIGFLYLVKKGGNGAF